MTSKRGLVTVGGEISGVNTEVEHAREKAGDGQQQSRIMRGREAFNKC